MKPARLLACFLTILAANAAHAIEIKVSAKALEQTLQQQLFAGEGGRYYIRGNATSACFVYAEDPKVTFKDDRILVHVKTHAKLGTSVHGACIGLDLKVEADVSVLPESQGETIGFRDARVEQLNSPRELNFLLIPFLSKKLPQEMKINAADIVRKTLTTSTQTTGYAITLDDMKVHSMQVDNNNLVVDLDGTLSVH